MFVLTKDKEPLSDFFSLKEPVLKFAVLINGNVTS